MLFQINDKSNTLNPVTDNWKVSELELEKYILSSQDDGVPTLNYSVFNEELLIIKSQARTRSRKRADLLAIDKMGNSVIIELKRDQGALGVETQALQYLADFSRFKGQAFLDRFLTSTEDKDNAISFIGGDNSIEYINANSRIILIANGFDSTLFSMGEWLFSKGVGFRCISYSPIRVQDCKFINFSLAFDKSPESLYTLEFSSLGRDPKIFWHNIGFTDDQWIKHIKTGKIITASFDCKEGDRGYQILRSYIIGDRIVAYAAGYGAIGYGVITQDPHQTYTLLKENDKGDVKNGQHLHRIHISWQTLANSAADAIKTSHIREEFSIYHPVSTSTGMDQFKGEQLITALKEQCWDAHKSETNIT